MVSNSQNSIKGRQKIKKLTNREQIKQYLTNFNFLMIKP